LQAALELQAQEFESRTKIVCHLTLPQEPLTLGPDKSIAIFRIFQESLTNVARHAHATRVDASLDWEDDHLLFRVHDNGKGFNPEETAARKSLGLLGMQERALLLNGELKLQGAPGAGTSMTLRIPLARSSTQPKKSC
jgi:signal transduction histidine kinase